MKRIICVCLLVILMMAALAGCGQKEQKKVSDHGFYLDTECTITVYTDDEEKGRKIIKDAFALCEEYEGKMSKTVKGSDIYRLNHANGEAVSVSDSVREVLSMGIEMGKESKGRFDITVGRLTDIWDFKSDEPKVPQESNIKAAMKTVDYEKLAIATQTYTGKALTPAVSVKMGNKALKKDKDYTVMSAFLIICNTCI